jgi:hypothetical protein
MPRGAGREDLLQADFWEASFSHPLNLTFEELDSDGSTSVRRAAQGLLDKLSKTQTPQVTLPLAQTSNDHLSAMAFGSEKAASGLRSRLSW